MDHLSACYFCGAALDEPLQDYRVVPDELRDDDAVTTATLCGTCHGKLERLLAPVVEAAGEDGATIDARETRDGTAAVDADIDTDAADDADGDATVEGGAGDTATEGSTVEGTTTVPSADPTASTDEPAADGTEEELVEVDDGLIDVDDIGSDEDVTEPESTGEDTTGDPFEELVDEEDGGDEDEGKENIEDAMDPDVPDELQADDSEAGHEPGDADDDGDSTEAGSPSDEGVGTDAVVDNSDDGTVTADEATDESETTDGETVKSESGTDREAGESGTDGADTGESGADGDTDESGTAQTTVSALEYNKVMRLLQNRKFPVDRQEIQTVAANAYGLAEHECAEVIDLAIDRGLIAERGGQLVRPDD